MHQRDQHDLSGFEAEYTKSNKYKYGKPVTPEFNGAVEHVMDFIMDALAFVDIKGFPNSFSMYLMRRKLPVDFSEEQQAADHELYSLMQGWYKGTAKGLVTNHLMTRSGHLVWKDLVDKFLKQTPQMRAAVNLELSNISFKDDNHKLESVPQYFHRLRSLAIKLQAVGGQTDEQTLVQNATTGLMAFDKMYDTVDRVLSQNKDADTFDLESALLEKMTVNRVVTKKRTDRKATSSLARAQAQLAQAEAHLASQGDNPTVFFGQREQGTTRPGAPTPPRGSDFQRPWQRKQRDPRDRTGIGNDNGRPDWKPNRPKWQGWKGATKEAALAQVRNDYEAQVAAVERSHPDEYGTAGIEDATAHAFDAGLNHLAAAAATANEDPYCGTFEVATDGHGGIDDSTHTHVIMTVESHLRLTTPAETEDPTMDSGTSHNIWRGRENFSGDFTACKIPITHAGNSVIYAEGKGTVMKDLLLPSGRLVRDHPFPNSLFVPGASRDLISTTELEEQGHAVLFKKDASALILQSGVRVPLTERGRLRTLPLGRAVLPDLRNRGWQQLPPGGDLDEDEKEEERDEWDGHTSWRRHDTGTTTSAAPAPKRTLEEEPPTALLTGANNTPLGTRQPAKKKARGATARTAATALATLVVLATAMSTIMQPTCTEDHVAMLTSAEQQHLSHRRAIHYGHAALRRTAGLCRGFDYRHTNHPPFCDCCPAGNSKYPSLKSKRTRASQPMERVHCDLWGRTQVSSLNGNRYVICFVDDFSRHIAVYFLKKKSDAPAALLKYIDEHSTPLHIDIRSIQSDGGGEFIGEFADICRVNGIVQHFSAPDLQAQNSVAERTWGTLVSATLRMLEDAQLPAAYFEDAMMTAAWVKNRLYSTAVDGMTPQEALWNERPDLSLLRVWGSPAYVHIPQGKVVQLDPSTDAERKLKLNSKVRPAVFVGYTPHFKAWRFYDPSTKSYFTSRIATFNERVGDSTPTLKLLKHDQPDDLELSELAMHLGDLELDGTAVPPNPPNTATDNPSANTRQRNGTGTTFEGRGTKGANAAPAPQSPLLSQPDSNRANTRWMPTPRDNMTVRQLARYFNVNYKSYHKWMSSFSPFGVDAEGKDEEMKLTSVGKKGKATRFEQGTDVPVPISDADFAHVHATTQQQQRRSSLRQRHNNAEEATSVFLAFSLTVTAAYHTLVTPTNYGKVQHSPQRDEWWESMTSEYTSLVGLGTWTLQPRKPGDKVIGSMWSYKIKENADGSIDKLKSRLVARGDQQASSSYSDIFAPVIKFVTLRILLAIACVMDWDLAQVDIGNAYCNAFVTDDNILMRQPPGFEQRGPNGEELVCRLRKSLYGLKQAGREWNSLLNEWLVNSKWKLTRCRSDYCLYYANTNGKVLLVGVYVGDLVITGNDPALIRAFKADIATRFKITDLGELKWILGMEVERDRKNRTLTLHQRKYINDILELFDMQNCHPKQTPSNPSARLSKADSPETEKEKAAVDLTKYRCMVGKLVYLMVASEPIISFAVSQLSRFFSCPGPSHFSACRWAISYLKGIHGDQGITFRGAAGFNLHAYCDSDWAGCPDTRRSTSGYVVMFAGAAVSWISKRQPTVALSSAEAEYVTACLAAQEVQWIRQLLAEIGVPMDKGPTVVHSDSQSAMHMANNPTAGRAKHIDIKYHFVKEAREREVVEFRYCNTNVQAADVLTKSLARPKVVQFRNIIEGKLESLHVHALTSPARS